MGTVVGTLLHTKQQNLGYENGPKQTSKYMKILPIIILHRWRFRKYQEAALTSIQGDLSWRPKSNCDNHILDKSYHTESSPLFEHQEATSMNFMHKNK